MTADDILDGLEQREGLHRPQVTRPDGTIDPETMRGITWPTYRTYCAIKMIAADHAAFLALTSAQARAIYVELFIEGPGFTAANIPFEPLRVQLIDFGVNSGPERAIRWLQRVLRMKPEECDGQLGPRTLSVLRWRAPDPTAFAILNDALVAARSYMIDRAVDTGSMRKADEEGVESRALSFFLATP